VLSTGASVVVACASVGATGALGVAFALLALALAFASLAAAAVVMSALAALCDFPDPFVFAFAAAVKPGCGFGGVAVGVVWLVAVAWLAPFAAGPLTGGEGCGADGPEGSVESVEVAFAG
jgi:hypothetical protein